MSTNYNVQLKDPENPDNFWMPITLKGNITDLTTFDSTHYSTAGLVPASGGESNKFLCANGNWTSIIPNGGYGVCSTAASTQVKEVTVTNNDFSLVNGVVVQVTFTNANSNAMPMLKVNNTTAKGIAVNSSIEFSDILKRTYNFVYNSTDDVWYVIGKDPSASLTYETWTFTTAASQTYNKVVALQS